MSSIPEKTVVVVVGAGTAGAAAAYHCAKHGLDVVCLDSRPLGQSGARWVNGVADWLFEAADIPNPPDEERMGGTGRFHLIAGYGDLRVTVPEHALYDLDMRHLVQRLQNLAQENGASLHGEVRVDGLTDSGVATSAGPISADWVVDASGLAGARLLGDPELPPQHICAAAQYVFQVVDHNQAHDWLETRHARENDAVCFSSIEGGYSILNISVHGDQVSVLTGSVPALGNPSGKKMLDRFVDSQPWIGQRLFGGSRAIPIRRPWDLLGTDRVALLGDTACQVFPAHGSGIGAGMLAARILAESLAAGRGLDGYNHDWHRRWGGLFAAYDAFRRFSQRLTVDDLERLIDSGLMDEESVAAGIAQRLPTIDPAVLPKRLFALFRLGRLSTDLAALIHRMAASAALHRVYPAPGRRLLWWSRAMSLAFGDPPDPYVVGAMSRAA